MIYGVTVLTANLILLHNLGSSKCLNDVTGEPNSFHVKACQGVKVS
jgi:hypothetical protein